MIKVIKLKKRYFLILILAIFVLCISYVNATTDNITINEENNTNLEINETNTTIAEVTNSTPKNNVELYKEPTKKQRTFKIGKYKVVLSKKQYKKLFLIKSVEKQFKKLNNTEDITRFKGYDAWDNRLSYYTSVKTNKYVKIKVRVGPPVVIKPDKIKYKYKKVRVYMIFDYNDGLRVKNGYAIKLGHTGGYRGQVLGKNAKYFYKCKYSKSFNKLKKSKLIKETKVFIPLVFDG